VIVRVAVLPHPPLLVPEVAAGAAGETALLRAACLTASRALARVSTRWVAVASAAPESGGTSVGTFAGYGVDVRVGLEPRAGFCRESQPLPLLVAGWLRGQVAAGEVTVHPETVAPGTPPPECAAAGRRLAQQLGGPEPVGLLVLGDGAATHTPAAPGYFDPRAEAFDAGVSAALAAADADALLRLDAGLAAQLRVAGREAWQVGAAAARVAASAWRGELLHSSVPYGVAYHVALWEPAT